MTGIEPGTLSLLRAIVTTRLLRDAVAGTDGGLGWPECILKRDQIQAEDTWHNNKNAITASTHASKPKKFLRDVRRALYEWMSEDDLLQLLNSIVNKAAVTAIQLGVSEKELVKSLKNHYKQYNSKSRRQK